MTSPADTGPTRSPLEETPGVSPPATPSQAADIGSVRVEDNKKQDGKKKKPNKRSAGAKKRGTGFEEYYCDPPMTAAEYSEERDVIYASHRPFVDRIEECIQRYRARRRLGPQRDTLFSRYLVLGGIDTTVRQFQGTRNITDDVLQDASKGDVREMTADDVIQRGGDGNRNPRFFNPNFPEHWEVDFTGVAAGFVSEHLRKMVGSNTADYLMGVDVVLNFLKYVDRHDVCPEYADDVRNAQKVCRRALEEVPVIWELLGLLPGHFNTALRTLHVKGDDEHSLDLDSYWGQTVPEPKYAKISTAATLSILLGAKNYPTDVEWSVTDKSEMTFEVLAISHPSDAVQAKYKAINRHLADYPDIEPCGTITVRPVIVRDGWDNSVTATIPHEVDAESQLIVEEGTLELMELGMKLTMGVCTLSVGLKFVRYVKEIRPSFYLFLPQELMFTYKEPVPNDRPAKSVHDFDGEDDMAGAPGGDDDD
ncbi:hypothetical protein N658DRAFT_480496 [Parathielavia hyrcaniae]|uniref:Argonaute complex, subunit Arb1 n=1 Tax=Parathielavia hyrcaniae TaxID=113614 RepID=A0AAN6PT29_9PEZI|nr:hypothetical protein N658DRAFT_480496 [Parathielavia hyrcaniae]